MARSLAPAALGRYADGPHLAPGPSDRIPGSSPHPGLHPAAQVSCSLPEGRSGPASSNRPLTAAGGDGATAARQDSLVSAQSPSPRGALLRSVLVPGWGQVYNGKPVKAALFTGTTAGLAGWAIAAQQDVNRINDKLDLLRQQDPESLRIPGLEQQQQDLAARRNTRLLYVVLAVTGAALDAYVDAHLAGFNVSGPVAVRTARLKWCTGGPSVLQCPLPHVCLQMQW